MQQVMRVVWCLQLCLWTSIVEQGSSRGARLDLCCAAIGGLVPTACPCVGTPRAVSLAGSSTDVPTVAD
jgi:hypothetical protein